MSGLKDELSRRRSHTQKVLQLFLLHPGAWMPWDKLATVGGVCAWRTRVSDVRKLLRKGGLGDIVWNKSVKDSAYKFEERSASGERSRGEAEAGLRGDVAGARQGNLREGW